MNAHSLPPIQAFKSKNGVDIYRIPMVVFPNGFIGYSYVLLGAGVPTLVDTGSGFDRSTDDLINGIARLKPEFGVPVDIKDIERIIITHGHVDHFGGLSSTLEAIGTEVPVGIHPLDRRNLSNYEERVIIATTNLTIYLERAGVNPERLSQLLNMYGFSKKHVRSVNIAFTFEEEDVIDGMEFYHVPGHCPGQVAIRIGDVLLSADHILSHTSPHVAAESITHYTGLGHYRESLRKIRKLEGINLTLGGHEDPIHDLQTRIDYLQSRIDTKIGRIKEIVRQANQPLTISEISKSLYRDKHGFDVLLALQEAGAYVEYLYERGYLRIVNLEEVEAEHDPVILYAVLD